MNQNPKTSPEAFKFYRRWEKALLAADIKLPKGCTKTGLWAYCSAMAVKGTNGLDCYAGDETIRAELGIYHRDTVTKYRHAAIELGWLESNGKPHGRCQGLNIAIPTVGVTVPTARTEPARPKPAVPTVEHDPNQTSAWCPACEMLWSAADADGNAIDRIHAEAISKLAKV